MPNGITMSSRLGRRNASPSRSNPCAATATSATSAIRSWATRSRGASDRGATFVAIERPMTMEALSASQASTPAERLASQKMWSKGSVSLT
jgi:hypothetical protein